MNNMPPYVLYIVIIAFVLVSVATAFFKTPRGKGIMGEWIVDLSIGKSKPGYRVVNNLMFNDGQKSVQIDHIVVNDRGVFVIETKNYSGRIYGDEEGDNWTQVLAYGKVKNKLYNPINQNKGHIYSLKKSLISIPNLLFHSIIVFTGASSLYLKTTTPVVRPIALKNSFKKIGQDRALTAESIDDVYAKLVAMKSSNDVTLKEHIASIDARQQGIKENVCPRCGGKLVERKGKNGVFIGCSNYPKCTFIKKVQ